MTWSSTHTDYLIENSPDLLLICKSDGTIVEVSPNWEAALGYTPVELRKLNFLHDLVTDEHKDVTAQAISHVHQAPLSTTLINTYRHKDGSVRHVAWRASQWDKNGMCIAIGRVITHEMWGKPS